jgi:hypothetical protein
MIALLPTLISRLRSCFHLRGQILRSNVPYIPPSFSGGRWKCRPNVPLKCRLTFRRPHGVISKEDRIVHNHSCDKFKSNLPIIISYMTKGIWKPLGKEVVTPPGLWYHISCTGSIWIDTEYKRQFLAHIFDIPFHSNTRSCLGDETCRRRSMTSTSHVHMRWLQAKRKM